MSIRRVLVLESVDDGITEYRKRRAELSPELLNYEIRYCYAVDLTERQRVIPPQVMMQEVEEAGLDVAEFSRKMKACVDEFVPDALVVHDGFVFHWFTGTMVAGLRDVKVAFPALRIAVENGQWHARGIQGFFDVFDDDTELEDLARAVV